MTILDEQYDDLLSTEDDPHFSRLVAELDTLREGSPSPRGDMLIRHALAVHARELAQEGGGRPTHVGEVRRRAWTRHLRARLGVLVAASVAVLLSMGAYLHGQAPTPVSAQTVLHRAAAAGPGPNEATHAVYRVSPSDGHTGTADVWIGYDASGTATHLALTMTMDGQTAGSVGLTVVGPGLTQLYGPGSGQVRAPSAPPPQNLGATGTCRGTCVPAPSTSMPGTLPPAVRARAMALSETLRGIVVGTLLAQKLSAEPRAYTLKQETLDGVSVYALQPADAPGMAYYFNAQTYVLQGADWMQGGSSWQVRLTSYSTVPLSAVPAHTFGSGKAAGRSGDK